MRTTLTKILMAGASPVLVLMMAGTAYAQSTGTQAVENIESVTVTGLADISGIMKPISVPKERSTITQDFINTQPAGQSVFESLNKVPGFIFTNQIMDSEIIATASVNQGTTDVDSPTAAATGGVVALTTIKPADQWGVMSDTSFGTNNYKREFLRIDTGEFGPWHTTAFVSGSYTIYDKFKGP